jgi:hypothetical protein
MSKRIKDLALLLKLNIQYQVFKFRMTFFN